MKSSNSTAGIFLAGIFFATLSVSALANESEAETAEPISRTEFVRQQYEMFNKADKNFDGQLTHDEVLGLSHESNKLKYVTAFKALDTNNNGFISSDELEAKHAEFTDQRVARILRRKDSLLSAYDLNRDGTITSQEIDTNLESQAQEQGERTAKNAANDLKSKDKDKSGTISLDEYLDSKSPASAANRKKPPGTGPVLTRDPNGDKIITRSENESFVSRAFEGLDKNGDDELSKAEQSNRMFGQIEKLSKARLYLASPFASPK